MNNLLAVNVVCIFKSFIFASANIKKMLEIIVLSVIILFVCLVLFGVRVIVKKNGKFPHTNVGGNAELRRKGITCARVQDFEAREQLNLFDRTSK